MNVLITFLVVLVLLASSCEKKGCTDEYALNFSANAEKDDGSCYSWSQCQIKSVELTVISDTSENGVEWDNDGLPDCFININYTNYTAVLETDVRNEVNIGEKVVYNLYPALIIYNSSSQTYWFSVYDKDSTSSLLMGEANFKLPKIPVYANSTKPSTLFQKRIKLKNVSNNKLISVTLVVEWI